MSELATVYSGPGYYELRGNAGPTVYFVEPAPAERQLDGWFKVSIDAEDRAREGTWLAPIGTLAELLIRKVGAVQ
jgi:hypothetical protein